MQIKIGSIRRKGETRMSKFHIFLLFTVIHNYDMPLLLKKNVKCHEIGNDTPKERPLLLQICDVCDYVNVQVYVIMYRAVSPSPDT